ncbi:gliding motility-associated C-terminal domain-containing protein [Algoriphagus aestuarii]|nr:gliding motility-associated C-terminal domain-containing protein [Algoriphagus aestuarii]
MIRTVFKSIFFFTVFLCGSIFSVAQTTVNFNSYTENQGLSNPHTEGELKFEVIKNTSLCTVCIGIDFNEGKDGTPGLDDDNFEINGIVGWKISKADNSSFQFLSIWLQHRGAGTSTSGTIKAFKGGLQVGSTVNINFDSNSAGLKSFSSNPDFYDVDEVRIEGIDLYIILDEITYGAPFIVGDADPAEVTGINLIGAHLSTATSVQYQVDFSKIAKNVSADDFTLTTTGTAIGTIGTVTGSNATYTVSITGISGEGTLRLDLKAGTNIANENDVTGTAAFTSGQIHNVSPCLVEDFEDETVGTKVFSYGGFDFVITGNMEVHTETPVSGINGSRNVLNNTGVGPYTLTSNSGEINLRRIALYLSSIADGSSPTNDGTITIVGKNGGANVYTISKISGFPTDFSSNSGYYILDLKTEGGVDNSIKSVDEIEITIGGAFQYLNIDNFEFCADDVAPSGYTVSIDQDPITQDNENAVSFTFAAAEIGSTYDYTFTSSGGGTPVIGTGTILTATDQIAGINLSGLGVGLVNLSVSLTDASNNKGLPATANVQKRINTAPVATPPTAPVVMEDITVALADDIQVSDNEGDDQTVTFTVTGGTVTLGTTDITFGGSGNGSANFTASGTLAAINTALDAATFTPALDLFGTNAGIISFVTNDGAVDSNLATVTFDIAAVNDPPNFGTITVNKDYNEGSASTALGIVLLSDSDNVSSPTDETISKATITNTIPATGDLISVGTPGPFAVSTAGDVTTISGSGSIEDMIAALASLAFENTTDDPTEGDANINRSITITVEDDEAAVSNVLTFNIRVIPSNDDPTFIGLPSDISVQDGVASNVDLSSATFGDVDSGSGNVTLSFLVSGGTLSATGTADVSVSFPIPGAMNLVGTAAAIEAFLNAPSNILYTNAPGATGDNVALLNVTANDNGNTGTGGGLPVNFGSINIDVQELPSVSSVSVPANGTYSATQNLNFIVNYSEVVIISGVPSFELTIGSTVYEAEYVSGSGSSALLFRYTVQPGDLDTDGISVGAIISLNGGSIQNSSAVDAGLNLNSVGSTAAVFVDAVPPAAPSTPDLSASSDTGSSNTDNITSDNTPTFIGTAEANSLVSLRSNVIGTLGAVFADGTGNWSFTPGTPIADGGHEITAVSSDNAGNTSIASASLQIEIDTQAPAIPNVPDLLAGDDSGISDSDNLTNVRNPTIQGTAEANSTILLYNSEFGNEVTMTDGTGNWSLVVANALPSGPILFHASATDLAGNTSPFSDWLTLIIDYTPPVAVVDNINLPLDASGNASLTPANILLSVSDGYSDPSNISLSIDKNNFACSDVGIQNVNLTATDEAGNSSSWLSTITVQDKIGPEVRGKDITVNVGAFSSVIVFPNMVDDGSSDACGISSLSTSPALFTKANAGVNDVTFRVTDFNGNSNSVIVKVTIVVVPKVLNVTVTAGQSKVYGDGDPVFAYQATGFEGGDDIGILTGSLSRTAGEDVGSYEIGQGTLDAGPNYTINFIGADFEITPATLDITADAGQSKVYGDSDPVFTYQYSGLKNGDTKEGVITGALAKAAGEDVGIYPINLGTLDAGGNYTVNYRGANFEITPATLNITADAGQSKIYGDLEPTLTYQATGFRFSDDKALITGDLTRIAGDDVGMYTIQRGTIDAGTNYTINFAGADFEITPATLNITADAGQSKIYGAADPVFTYQYSGLKNGDTDAIITGELQRTAGENLGTYPINQGTVDAGSNYNINYTGADFTIGEKILTVTVNAGQSKLYGDADPAFSYQATGFEGGDNISILTGALSRTAGEDVGTYAITKGTLDAGPNYTINFIGSDFEINPVTLAITAETGQSKVYGDTDPVFMYVVSGLKNGDTQAVISGSLERALGENVGFYAIMLGTVDAGGNYNINYTGADFEITRANLDVTAEAGQMKTYGDTDPVFTYTVNGLKNGDTNVVVSGALSRVAGEDVGMYAIQQGTVDAGPNYILNFTSLDFEITKATLNITANAGQTKVYGSADPIFTYVPSGFKNGDTDAVLSGSLIRFAGEDVGMYAIQPGTIDAGPNYSINFISADFEITKAGLNVTANAGISKIYGNGEPTLTYQITGFKNGDDLSIITGSLARAPGENVGSYLINLGTLSAGDNYSIIFTEAEFEITTRTLNVVANPNQAKVYGSPDPVLTYTVTNFGNGDTDAIMTGALSREFGVKKGKYAILIGTLSAGPNYTINFTSATFTIAAKVLNITADAGQNKVFGTADPVFTYSATGFEGGDNTSILTGSLTRAPGENVGSYAIQLGNLSAGENYAINFVSSAFTISKATITGITFEDGSFVYDGTAKSLMISGTLPSGTSVAYTNNSRTEVGTQEVVATISGSNYNQLVLKADLNITPATITGISLADGSFVYDGTAKSLMISGVLPTGTSVAYTNNSRTEVGTQEVTATISGSNYSTLVLMADLTVLPANIGGLTFEDGTFEYDGTAKSLAITGTLPAGTSVTYANNSRTEVGTQVVTATISGANFTEVSLTADLSITPATLTVVVDDGQSKEFGSIDPVLTYDVTGFKGTDTNSILTGALSREPGEDVGTYLINQGSLDAGNNYTIDFTGAEFSIVEELTIDSDGDGVPDNIEKEQGTDPSDPMDYQDEDGDDVPDYVENIQGTDPTDPGDYLDTDGDDVPDYVEEQQGTDPNDETDFPDVDEDGIPDYVNERSIIEFIVQGVDVLWGTPESDLKLPTEVVAMTSIGEFINLPVVWNLVGYEAMVAGSQSFEGTVQLPDGLFNPESLIPSIQVTVLSKPSPQDVILSENSFIAIPDVFFQEIGTFTVIDPVDDQHTLSLPEGVQDNNYFEVIDGILFWSSSEQAQGRTDFTILLRVEDRGGNVLEKSFQISRQRTPLDQLELTNTFTPNGDGVNDTWGVPALRYYQGVRISIMEVGGNRVFYTENPDIRWDGTFDGKELPVGAYFWIIEVEETGEVRRGVLNLLRQ